MPIKKKKQEKPEPKYHCNFCGKKVSQVYWQKEEKKQLCVKCFFNN